MTDEELRKLFDSFRQENAAAHDVTRRSLREENAEAHEHTRRKFETETERVSHKIDLLADGLRNLDEKVDRESADIRGEMRRGFAETQAMIKFSHSDLDRRVTTLETGHRNLEETVAELQARVGRLESSTH